MAMISKNELKITLTMTAISGQRLHVWMCFATLLFSFFWSTPPAHAQNRSKRPNIIICLADDQGYGDAGFMGHPDIKTPVLDEMAANGVTFSRFYAAAPRCTPTRGSIMTGRHPIRFGAFAHGHTLRPQEGTIAEALQESGYQTGFVGKWHLGPIVKDHPVSPGKSGFDHWVAAYNWYNNNPWFSVNGKAKKFEGESSMVTMRQALAFIERANERPEPFFNVVSFGNPHQPHKATDELKKLYSSDLSSKMRNYLGEITGIDRAMGHLRQRLREMGIAEKTLIWYTSDNGGMTPHASNGYLRGRKGQLWEGGIRVPTIIEWPGQFGDRQTDIVATTSDLYPTLLDLAGVDIPDQKPVPLDGVSLVDELERIQAGESVQRKEPVGFWSHPVGGRTGPEKKWMRTMHKRQQKGLQARPHFTPIHPPDRDYPEFKKRKGWGVWMDGDWKLLRRGGNYQLYNLAEDPGEQNNLIKNHPERAQNMKQELKQWQQSVYRSLKGNDYK